LPVAGAALALTGCSAKDPVTQTPVYHIGTPTNSSSANSWELGQPGLNIQPGRYRGKGVVLPAIPSQRGFEPGDPLALAVQGALAADPRVPTRYLTISAKAGTVVLGGSVTNPAQKVLAVQIARRIPGVKILQDKIEVIPAG